MKRGILAASLLVTGAIAWAAPAAGAASVLDPGGPITGGTANLDATYRGTSADGQTVAFSTAEALVAADTDGKDDLYVRRGTAAPVLLTPGTSVFGGGDTEYDASSVQVLAGGDVLFTTRNRLAGDLDDATDVLLARTDGTTVLVSSNGGSNLSVTPSGLVASADGTTVAFTTTEQLLPADTQSAVPDVYRYRAGVLELVTRGDAQGTSTGISPDGGRVYWESTATQAGIADADGNGSDLFYADGPGFTTVRSPTATNAGSGSSPSFAGQSPDGGTIVLRTTESFDAANDGAGTVDLYAFRGNAPAKLLTGSGSTGGSDPRVLRVCDGGAVAFSTEKNLGGDNDAGADDVYRATTATTTRLTSGDATSGSSDAIPAAISADCSAVAWVTLGKEVAADADSTPDLYYAKDGLPPTLVSTGAGTTLPPAGVATLGANVLFGASNAFAAADVDGFADVYRWDVASGAMELVTTAAPAAPGDQVLAGQSADGQVAIIRTDNALQGDTDTTRDLYRYGPPPAATGGTAGDSSSGGPGPATGGGGTTGGGPGGTVPAPRAKAGTLRLTARGARLKGRRLATKATVTCAAGGGACTLTVGAKLGKRTAGTGRLRLKAGKGAKVGLKLRKRLHGRRKLVLTVKLAKPGAATVTKRFTVVVKG